MAQFIIRRLDGSVKLTDAMFMARKLGTFSLNAGDAAGSMSVPDLAQGKPYLITLPNQGAADAGANMKNPHTVTVSGTTISWTPWPLASGRCGCLVIYGTY